MLKLQAYQEGFPQAIFRRTWEGGYMDRSELGNRLTVVTTTRYPDSRGNEVDSLRSEIAYRNFAEHLSEGHNLLVIDGGSDDFFLGKSREMGVEVQKGIKEGMGPGLRQGFEIALDRGGEFYLWTEPEKVGMAGEAYRMVTPLARGKAGATIPFRVWKTLKGYPDSQRHFELAMNLAYQRYLGQFLDLTAGPKYMTRDVLEEYLIGRFQDLMRRTGEAQAMSGKPGVVDDWAAHQIAVLLMVHDGVQVGDVDSEFIYPLAQAEQESQDSAADMKRGIPSGSLMRSLHLTANDLGIIRSQPLRKTMESLGWPQDKIEEYLKF